MPNATEPVKTKRQVLQKKVQQRGIAMRPLHSLHSRFRTTGCQRRLPRRRDWLNERRCQGRRVAVRCSPFFEQFEGAPTRRTPAFGHPELWERWQDRECMIFKKGVVSPPRFETSRQMEVPRKAKAWALSRERRRLPFVASGTTPPPPPIIGRLIKNKPQDQRPPPPEIRRVRRSLRAATSSSTIRARCTTAPAAAERIGSSAMPAFNLPAKRPAEQFPHLPIRSKS